MRPHLLALLAIAAAPLPLEGQEHSLDTFRKRVISDRFHAEGAAFGDLDRDGATDVVAGPYWGSAHETDKIGR